MPFPAISTLFVRVDPVVLSGVNSKADLKTPSLDLLRLFPLLNFTSTCYLLGHGAPEDEVPFHTAFLEASAYLRQHTFLQLTLRPVHTFSPETTRGWMQVYQRWMQDLRPFQEEGYRQQIVSRLRIFPLIFFPRSRDVEEARAFLAFLNKNFFLPSILLPDEEAPWIESLNASGALPEWERIYLTASQPFDPERILETLVANTLMDTLLEATKEIPLDREPLCRGILISDGKQRIRTCLREEVKDLKNAGNGSWFERAASDAPCSQSLQVQGDSCSNCLAGMLEKTGKSFHLNQRRDSWREICERVADRLRRTGRNNSALRVWEMCIQSMPAQDVPAHLRVQKALLLYEQGELEKAMVELTEARQVDGASPEIRFYMGLCEFGWKDYIEAADRFREALEFGLQGPMKQETEYLRGESHYHLQEYDEALDALRKAEGEGRRDSPLFFYIGLSLLGKENPREALASLKEALSQGPSPEDLFHVFFYIAHACKELEDYNEALVFCKKAIEIRARSQETYNLMGFCHFKQGQHDDAIRCFEKAIEIDPSSAIDYANIGSNLRDKGDQEGAEAMYRKALSLDPRIDFARENLERIEKKMK